MLPEFLIKVDKTSVASPHCFMQTIVPCISLYFPANISVALSTCCDRRIKIGFCFKSFKIVLNSEHINRVA